MIWEGFILFGLFGKVSEGMVPAPLCVSVEFGCEPVWTWAFMCGRLLIAAATSDLVIGLFIVSASSWFMLGRTQESGIYPFLPGLLVYVHIVACNIL